MRIFKLNMLKGMKFNPLQAKRDNEIHLNDSAVTRGTIRLNFHKDIFYHETH